MLQQRVRKTHRILHRLTGALRAILQHRIGGIAKQRDTAVDRALSRSAVAQHPNLKVLPCRMMLCARTCTCRKPCITSSSELARDRLRRAPAPTGMKSSSSYEAGPNGLRLQLDHPLGADGCCAAACYVALVHGPARSCKAGRRRLIRTWNDCDPTPVSNSPTPFHHRARRDRGNNPLRFLRS
jgi:hypothetical protein